VLVGLVITLQCLHYVFQPWMALLEPYLVLFETQLCHPMLGEKLCSPRNSVTRDTQLLRYLVQFMPCAVHNMHPDIPEKHRTWSARQCLWSSRFPHQPRILLTPV